MLQSIDQTAVDLLTRLCDEVATPIAYKAGVFAKRGDWVSLFNLKVEPTKYCSATHYLRDAQVVSLLKKFPDLGLDSNYAKGAAIKSFFEAEAHCYWTNERLNPLLSDSRHYGDALATVLACWRKEIKRVLGRCPSPEQLLGRFGPGSTFSNKGDLITLYDKLETDVSTTRRAFSIFGPSWDQTAWSRYAAADLVLNDSFKSGRIEESDLDRVPDFAIRDIDIVPGNRFTTVPKTALTDRGICIEPSLNLFYQLAIGQFLSDRLKFSYGWSKKTVQSFHRTYARLGSINDSNATIDLSMASDTVCSNLVELLLPRRWFSLLTSLRCSKTFIEGRWIHLEKYSSMGNGYTFELETLIFYTLAQVICAGATLNPEKGRVVSVFGDDIIVPSECGRDMVSALKFFGFIPNERKTFLRGPFRESCGGDYFLGEDVRCHYFKESLDQPHKWISAHNGLRRYRVRREAQRDYVRESYPWETILANKIPRQIRRCRGPEALGDLVLHDDDRKRWDTETRNSIRYLRVWRPVLNRDISFDYYRPGVVHAGALYRAGTPTRKTISTYITGEFRDGITPRISGSYVSGYRFGRVAYS